MPAKRSIISTAVGDTASKNRTDVRRVQTLLQMLGYDLGSHGVDGGWGDTTRAALASAVDNKGKQNPGSTNTSASRQISIAPNDDVLMKIAWNAGCLIPMPKSSGRSGFLEMHKWLIKHPRTTFSWHKIVYGLAENTKYALVMTTKDKMPTYAELNCSLYANMMMSIWKQGHCHASPFDAGISQAGRLKFAKWRYGYPLLKVPGTKSRYVFKTTKEIKEAVGKSQGLFCLEKCNGSKVITHMAMLLQGRVYECNYPQNVGCQDHSLDDWWRSKTYSYLSGPA